MKKYPLSKHLWFNYFFTVLIKQQSNETKTSPDISGRQLEILKRLKKFNEKKRKVLIEETIRLDNLDFTARLFKLRYNL